MRYVTTAWNNVRQTFRTQPRVLLLVSKNVDCKDIDNST